jgi:membrane-associated phospholipid phosphatase
VSATVARLAGAFVVLLALGWGVGELWSSAVGVDELSAVETVVESRTDALTSAAKAVTWLGSSWVVVPLAAVCCIALLRAGLPREALAMAVSLGGAILLWHAVKLLVGRPRPTVEHLAAVGGSSFPSGHATQASAFWLSAVFALRRTGAGSRAVLVAAVLACIVVAAVAFSRVYLGVHYPSDVVAGVLLGGGWAAVTWRCLARTPHR